MVELRGFMLDDFVLQLDVPLQGGFGTVETIAAGISAWHFVQNVFVAPPLHLFGLFFLPPLNFKHTFEQLQHNLMFRFGLFYLPLQKLLPLGQENQLFGWMDGYRSLDLR